MTVTFAPGFSVPRRQISGAPDWQLPTVVLNESTSPSLANVPEAIAAVAPDRVELKVSVIDSVEESVVNALLAARTTWGRAGHVLHELPIDRLQEILRKK